MKAKAGILLALWCGLALAQASPLSVAWNTTNTGLIVQREVAGCLVLLGGSLPDKHLSDIPCDASPVLLRSGGIDYLEAPQKREAIQLRGADGSVLGSVAIPARVWEQTLVLVVK